MTESNWRELCAELTGWIERATRHYSGLGRVVSDPDVLTRARAALAEPERQPAPPAEGEVVELVALIRQIALAWEPDACLLGNMTAGQLTRAADLLEQRHPEPVPVSERLPGPEDCDAEERCWLLAPRWILPPSELTHWLPATAKPLPAGEVERQSAPVPVPVSERLPELRGMFERILCVARSSGQRPVGNIQLADRLISAVVSWSALPLPAREVQP